MHFTRTEEQDQLATMIRSLLGRRSDSAAVRAAIETDAGYDEPLWQTMCEQIGVAALPVPEEYGGAGASLVESAVVLEELGLTPSPLLASALAAAALLTLGSPAQLAELLPRIAAGEPATLVLDPALVIDGDAASIVLAPAGERLVQLDRPGMSAVRALDPTLRFARLDDPHPVVPSAALDDVAAALATALQVGAAQHCLDLTVAYSKERVQFGRPIGSFQALKHRMADMLVLVEASRSASWAATAAASAYVQEPGAATAATLSRHATLAQAYCSDALDHVASETVQLHGGIAITWEHDAQLLFKRAHALSQLFGQAHEHRARLPI